jgi:RNA polymerase primary sigma factor
MREYDNTLKAYLEEIAKNPVLTREQEVALFKRYERHDPDAKEKIIESNLRFVVKIALQYIGKGLTLPDLIQEGNIGLMEVIDKFDWRRGYRFSTYAAFWIRQTIQIAIRRQNSMVKLPLRKARLMGRLTEFMNTFMLQYGREPSEEEIMEGLKIDKQHLDIIMPWRDSVLSLDSGPNESADYSLYHFISSTDTRSPRDIYQENERRDMLNLALSALTDREQRVMRLRYGFDNSEPLSLRQASRVIGLSQEGVRKIEKRALDKLRRPATRAKLGGLL